MEVLDAPILTGLRFNQRDSNFERLFNFTLTAKRDTLVTRRSHHLRFSIPAMVVALIQYNGFVYSLANDGGLRFNTAVIDSGYATRGSFHITVPSLNYNVPHLFVAADKMRKVNLSNNVVTNWGIVAPTAPLGVLNQFENIVSINACDGTTNWTISGAGFTFATDNVVLSQGTGSLQVTVPANTPGFVTYFPPVPIDLSSATDDDEFKFDFRSINPQAITNLTIQLQTQAGSSAHIVSFDLGPEGSAKGLPAESQYTGAPGSWKDIIIKRGLFRGSVGSWSTLTAVIFTIVSTAAQVVHIDNIRVKKLTSVSHIGNRWAYRYYNSVTKHSSNLSAPTSPPAATNGNAVTLFAFVVSPDPQVNEQQIFRDFDSNGNFQLVATKPNDTNNYIDNIPDRSLGEIDLNDNAVPLAANLIAFAHGRLWINDTAVPDRLWRSQPGRYEAMSEFFNVGTQEPITFIGMIAGQFTVITTSQIIRVINADSESPVFIPLTDIGGISPTAASLRGDTADLLHLTGLFNFNGSTITPLPHVNTLFDQSAIDNRRINWSNVHTAIVGSSNNETWLTYRTLNGPYVTFVFDGSTQEWFEENNILVAHDTAHLTINHIAGDIDGNIWDIYGDQGSFAQGIHIPRILDITKLQRGTLFGDATKGISRITGFSLEYLSMDYNAIILSVDEIQIGPAVIIPPSVVRRWFHIALDGIGKRLAWQLQAINYTELYAANWQIVEMASGDSKSFDTGDICLGESLFTPVEIVVQMYAHNPLQWHGWLWLDGQINEGTFNVPTTGVVLPQRFNLRPYAGRTVRFKIDSTEPFSIISAVIGAFNYGTGELKSMVLYPTPAR